ncbi:phenylacetate-CoA ligase [Pricia antarctica]|uniref:Phenylacetate-CoA ligase n=1 Tax=Pricia antarctica TaxID=641691 RepID=A0A1G7EV32_9FLAO|nr:phenylacetate--CoA ligase family protein [Pricia antarctica]SDE67508.1 phenylacetate-CoA ligase [Pricia antarctica]
MLQTFRKKLFWSLDVLKGSKIKTHYKDVKNILENFDSIESKKKRAECLGKLLKHAVNTTPFYKRFTNFSSLNDFPVINKNMIRDHYDDFKSSIFRDQKNYAVYTSGSTGTPFRIFHDKNKRDRHSADVTYFNRKAGFEIGHKSYYIRHWDQYNTSNPWMVWRKNVHMHPVSRLSHEDLHHLFDTMSKDTTPKGILCYASVLDEMKIFLDSSDTAPSIERINSIIAISETLKEDTKKGIEKHLGVPVVSRYANVENGILAQQFLTGNEFHINWASYFVEVLDMDTDEPAAPGERGRIVITDLYNQCMPMIRYDTGDLGQMDYRIKNGMEYPVLDRVEGRKLDMIYDTDGEMMSPYVVYHILKYPHIKQYQFIQEGEKKYLIKLNVSPEFNSGKNILSEFKKHLGTDAEILLDFVEDIPLLSSGKRKFVINKWRSNLVEEPSRLQA